MRWKRQLERLSDEEIKNKTQEFKQRIAGGQTLDSLLPEAFAVAARSQ